LKSLLAYLIGNVGNLVSAGKLKQALNVKSTSTISDYFSYFEQTYLLGFVPKFSYSYKARLLNPKKVYCVDNGVVSVASPSFSRDEGRRLENMVYTELRRRYSELFYYNENGRECDFVVTKNNIPALVFQVCYVLNAENREREIAGLLDAMNYFQLAEGHLLTFDQSDKILIDDKTIRVIPVHAYFN
jgi:predicted AAA+ superfamily ATPase